MIALECQELPRYAKLLINLGQMRRLRCVALQCPMPRHEIHAAKQAAELTLEAAFSGFTQSLRTRRGASLQFLLARQFDR